MPLRNSAAGAGWAGRSIRRGSATRGPRGTVPRLVRGHSHGSSPGPRRPPAAPASAPKRGRTSACRRDGLGARSPGRAPVSDLGLTTPDRRARRGVLRDPGMNREGARRPSRSWQPGSPPAAPGPRGVRWYPPCGEICTTTWSDAQSHLRLELRDGSVGVWFRRTARELRRCTPPLSSSAGSPPDGSRPSPQPSRCPRSAALRPLRGR